MYIVFNDADMKINVCIVEQIKVKQIQRKKYETYHLNR